MLLQAQIVILNVNVLYMIYYYYYISYVESCVGVSSSEIHVASDEFVHCVDKRGMINL